MSSVAIILNTFGPGARVTAKEKLPSASTSTGSPLMLTIAPAIVVPLMVVVLASRTLRLAGFAILRNKAGVDGLAVMDEVVNDVTVEDG